MPFRDRADAGRRLAARLSHLDGGVVVLGLPRGGVPVAAEVARHLGAPLDVALVRKLGVPYQPELAMGAVGEGGVLVVNREVRALAGIDDEHFEAVTMRARAELVRRAERLRGARHRIPLAGRTAVIVDDGIATGATARAACQVVRAQGAARVVVAVPVAPATSLAELETDADEVVCLETPEWFAAIGQWYDDFSQTSDEQVAALLRQSSAGRPDPGVDMPGSAAHVAPAAPPRGALDPEVWVRAGPVVLGGHLAVPPTPRAVVVFAHGSGSSRHSPRNRTVAEHLQQAGLATLLFDLLTTEEEGHRANVFDVGLLAGRLADVTTWVRGQPPIAGLPVCYFGASTGAAAALWAAAEPTADIAAVVSRGGRPDLAATRLADVRAPTLLVVGGRDEVVLELNRRSLAALGSEAHLAVVPGATHLFEEPGALDAVARLARDWFVDHLQPSVAG